MTVTGPAVLPGIRFEPQPPPPDDVLPRMDIVGFVGLAARGPVDIPVPVEDLASYTAVFGSDLVLGVDAAGNEATAQLRPAVAAFFRNGGRRCWVVRVAGPDARALTFPMPGVLRVDPDDPAGTRAHEAAMRASSVGSWPAGLSLGASLATLPARLEGARRAMPETAASAPDAVAWEVRLAGEPDIVPGDVVRFGLGPNRTAFAVIAGISERPGEGRWWRLGAVVAFEAEEPTLGSTLVAAWADGATTVSRPGLVVAATFDGVKVPALELALGGHAAPRVGGFVDLVAGGSRWWLQVAEDRVAAADRSATALLVGQWFRQLADASGPLDDVLTALPLAAAGDLPFVDRLRLAVYAASSAGSAGTPVLDDLGLAPGHARFAGTVPDDDRRFAGDPVRPRGPVALGRPAPAFAGTGDRGFLVPLGVGPVPLAWAAPLAVGTAVDVDDLRCIDATRFCDQDLLDVDVPQVIADADFIRYQAPEPRPLRGIHALLAVEEVTVVTVPDGALPAFGQANGPLPDTPPVPDATRPPRRTFEDCDPGAPGMPVLRVEWPGPDLTRFRVVWPAVPTAERYEIEALEGPAGWAPPTRIERRGPRLTVSSASVGPHRYRVRAINRYGTGAWSPWLPVTIRAPGALLGSREDRSDLQRLHVALFRMCAARGDLFALLSLSSDAKPADVAAHVAALREALAPAGASRRRGVPAPDADPLGVLSFGAVYHPWVVTVPDPAAVGVRRGRDALPLGTPPELTAPAGAAPTATGTVRIHPPDGAIAGIFAARAAARGAWVAPANVALRDIVAIDHPVPDELVPWLHVAGVNVVRRTPAGFLVLAAHTLSEGGLLRQVNVRRLLALLRRVALLRGNDYVFEPNDPAFRRRIERGFDAILASLFERGAFAGARASDAYRVSVDDPPNTPQSVDAGRLIVDLRVAPSVPLEFLTVRMVRTGDRFAVEVV